MRYGPAAAARMPAPLPAPADGFPDRCQAAFVARPDRIEAFHVARGPEPAEVLPETGRDDAIAVVASGTPDGLRAARGAAGAHVTAMTAMAEGMPAVFADDPAMRPAMRPATGSRRQRPGPCPDAGNRHPGGDAATRVMERRLSP